MRKIYVRPVAQLLAALAVIISTFAFAPSTAFADGTPGQTGTTGVYSWVVLNDGSLSITSVDPSVNGDITIPDTIDIVGDGSDILPVTGIGNSAFKGCSLLTGVTMPDSITAAGYEAFQDCTGLKSVTLSNNLQSIPDFMFMGCTSLKSITIPASVRSIGFMGFAYSGLTSVAIPDSVTAINDGAFSFCSALLSVSLPNNAGFTAIAPETFAECTALGAITIPPSVLSIGNNAFYEAGITSVDIPDSVTSIGDNAFVLCGSLSHATLPDNPGFTDIPDYLFWSCSLLDNITIPESVTSIGAEAFRGTGLVNITIPKGVATIGTMAFAGTALTGVSVDPANTHFSSRNGVLYDADQSDLICYPPCLANSDFIVPDGVSVIGDYAFARAEVFKVTVPRSIAHIGNYAFADSYLSELKIPNSSAVFGNTVTTDVWGVATIYGLDGSTAQQYANANSLPFVVGYYTVSFNSAGGSAVAPAVAQKNGKITKPADPSWPGHVFNGWYKEAACTTPWDFGNDTVSADTALHAKWAAYAPPGNNAFLNALTVGGKPVGGFAYDNYDYRVELPYDALPGGDAAAVNATPADPAARITVTQAAALPGDAKVAVTAEDGYTTHTYTIHLTLAAAPVYELKITAGAGGRITEGSGGKVAKGKAVVISAAPNAGYWFSGWEATGGGVFANAGLASTTFTMPGGAATVTARFTRVSAPSLAASSSGYTGVKLAWGATAGATAYEVYRATSRSGSYARLTSKATPGYTDTGLKTGKTYYYKIRAYQLAGGKKVYNNYSAIASAKPAPSAPAGVKAAGATATSIRISWSAVAGATKYEVYRARSLTGTYTLLARTAATSHVNTGLAAGKTYYYKVRAYHLEGAVKVYGPYSPVVYAKP